MQASIYPIAWEMVAVDAAALETVDATHPLLAIEDLILDQQPFLVVLVSDELLAPGRGRPGPYSHSRASEAPEYGASPTYLLG
jgi:hypothetical protein